MERGAEIWEGEINPVHKLTLGIMFYEESPNVLQDCSKLLAIRTLHKA